MLSINFFTESDVNKWLEQIQTFKSEVLIGVKYIIARHWSPLSLVSSSQLLLVTLKLIYQFVSHTICQRNVVRFLYLTPWCVCLGRPSCSREGTWPSGIGWDASALAQAQRRSTAPPSSLSSPPPKSELILSVWFGLVWQSTNGSSDGFPSFFDQWEESLQNLTKVSYPQSRILSPFKT